MPEARRASGGSPSRRWPSSPTTSWPPRRDARLADFVRELDERAAASHAPTVEGVTLASLHAAKGLEWDAVFLAGLSDGYLPITMAETAEAIEEERRLLYVGVTRARERLELSWSRARTPGGRATRRPSRFLDQTAPILGDGARSTARSGRSVAKGAAKAAKLARCRSCGGPLTGAQEAAVGRCGSCPATYDEATFERLRAWRLAVAQQSKVPAYVVFTDATLTAIAETEPSSTAQLGRDPRARRPQGRPLRRCRARPPRWCRRRRGDPDRLCRKGIRRLTGFRTKFSGKCR